MRSVRLPILLATLWCGIPVTAQAQVIGSFSWQTQPYCNKIAITITQQGSVYQLTGQDDLCGAGTASVTGTAVVAGNTVVMGFTVALPSGRAEHLSATINVATVSGPWSDADGHTGTFTFNGSGGSGARPAPATAAVITSAQLSPSIYGGTGAAATVARSDHDHDARYAGRLVRMLVDGRGLQVLAAEQLGTLNQCTTTFAGVTNQGFLPLDVPIGATLNSVVVYVYDGGGATSYSLTLSVQNVTPTGHSADVVGTQNGGAFSGTVTHVFTPSSPVVMTAGQSVLLSFNTGGASANGLCSAQVSYTLPLAP